MDDDRLKSEIARLLELERASNAVSYAHDRTMSYQGYRRIGWPGNRVVEDRFSELGVYDLLGPSTDTLDIGSNAGFTTVEAALSGRSAHGVEPNTLLNRIGALVASHLGAGEKTRFYDMPFSEFDPPLRYGVVLSLAAFHTHDGRERESAEAYFDKVRDCLVPGGFLVFESVSYAPEGDHRCPELVPYREPVRAGVEYIGEIFRIERSFTKKRAKDGAERICLVAVKDC